MDWVAYWWVRYPSTKVLDNCSSWTPIVRDEGNPADHGPNIFSL